MLEDQLSNKCLGATTTLHLTVRSSDTSSSATLILAALSLTAHFMAVEKSNSSSFPIFSRQPRRGTPNNCLFHATSLAYAEPILGFSQAELLKQWPLPHHLIGPCQVDSWPLPADVPHHPDDYPVAAPPKKKTRRN
ncbi:hypothetical protein EV2_015445 [Malus domestica]